MVLRNLVLGLLLIGVLEANIKLVVIPTPSSARVYITNIVPKYYDGINLTEGRYTIKVKKSGYKTYRKTFNLQNDKVLFIDLERVNSQKSLKSADYYFNLGIDFNNLKKYSLAILNFSKAIEINLKDAEAYYNRGIAYKKLEQYSLALSDYNKAIEIDPNYAYAYNNRGNIYYKLQEYNLAILDYTKAIEINPNDSQAYYNRGWIYSNLQKYQLAILDYAKAIEINPNYSKAYYNRGFLYSEKLTKHSLAISDFTKAIEINPNYAMAYNNRGIAYAFIDKWQKAKADAIKSIELGHNRNLLDLLISWGH